ncbi:MAG: OmpA family protein [Candidatus Methylacidiphilales bacterium]|nr:OmpA family protein [Candidatus Methylacidiphilales bacterium]
MKTSTPFIRLSHLHLALPALAALLVFAGCAKSVKGTGGAGGGIAGEDIYDTGALPGRGDFNPENADYSTLAAYTVYFAFDSYAIDGSERPKLEKIANWMNENSSARILVAGHTDSRGTIQYNVGLGERRSLAIRTYLMGLGVDGNRLHTISYGEERPAQQGENESAYAANRRAACGVLR